MQRKTLGFKIYTCLIRNIIFCLLIFTLSCFAVPTSFNFNYISFFSIIRCIRNTVILAILQCNTLKPTIQTHFPSRRRKILASEVASSNSVAKVTLTLSFNRNVTLAYFSRMGV